MRRRLTVLITFFAGLYFFLEFLLPDVIFKGTREGSGFHFGKHHVEITIGFAAVGTMALALGAISILRAHGGNVLRMRKNWGISLVLILSLFFSATVFASMWRTRRWSSSLPNPIREFSAAQVLILSSAKTPPIPAYMKNWPKEEVPAELQRPATRAERSAAEKRLVESLRTYQARQKSLPRPKWDEPEEHPSDAAARHLQEALASAEAGLAKLLGNDEDGASELFQKVAGSLQQAGTSQSEVAELLLNQSFSNHLNDVLFYGFYTALGSAMFSLLAFYIATAAYRAFRLQSGEAFLLMVAALLVMLGQIPVGVYLADLFLQPLGHLWGQDSFSITQVRLWLLRVVNTAAFRGITLGSAIAGLSMAWRVWWSMESGVLLDEGGAEDDAPGGSSR